MLTHPPRRKMLAGTSAVQEIPAQRGVLSIVCVGFGEPGRGAHG